MSSLGRNVTPRRGANSTDLDPQILRHGSDAADHHLVRVHVIALEAPVARVGTGNAPARPVRSSSWRRLPLVADIEAVLPVAVVMRLDQLQAADPVRHAEQERGEAL